VWVPPKRTACSQLFQICQDRLGEDNKVCGFQQFISRSQATGKPGYLSVRNTESLAIASFEE
jgi:hypothetical protein